jgi:hypothetical protein
MRNRSLDIFESLDAGDREDICLTRLMHCTKYPASGYIQQMAFPELQGKLPYSSDMKP